MKTILENSLLLNAESMIPLDEKQLINRLKSIAYKCKEFKNVVFELNWGGGSTVSISIFGQEGTFERNIAYIPNAFSSKTRKSINHPDIFDKNPNKQPSVQAYAMTQFVKVFEKVGFKKICKDTKFVAMYHDGKKKTLN
jgi:hypothetical protein